METDYYFGSRLIYRATATGAGPVMQDRLGSVWADSGTGSAVYSGFYPYGEEKGTATANDRVKFGTYRRYGDAGLDYAEQRYYSSALGRFLRPDPWGGSASVMHMSMWRKRKTKRVYSKEAVGMEAKTALKILLRAGRLFLIVALSISFLSMTGCLESTFNLANESRLPKWVALPSGVTRADVSITLNYYTSLGGDDAIVTLKDREGKTIAEVRGKMKCQTSFARYPAYEIVEINSITEVIEHKKMEPRFYITDDPAIKKMLFAGSRACE